MAKKKPAAESSVKVAAAKPQRKKPAVTKPASMSNDLIGDTAGKIWHALLAGPQNFADLKKSIDAPADLILVSVGWLAREGKLKFDSSGRSVTVLLR